MMRVIAAHLHALHKKLSLVGPTIGFGQKIVNGNEPQRAAQVKNCPETPFSGPKPPRISPMARMGGGKGQNSLHYE